MKIRIEATEDEIRERSAELAKALLDQLCPHDAGLCKARDSIHEHKSRPLGIGEDVRESLNMIMSEELNQLVSDIEAALE